MEESNVSLSKTVDTLKKEIILLRTLYATHLQMAHSLTLPPGKTIHSEDITAMTALHACSELPKETIDRVVNTPIDLTLGPVATIHSQSTI
jgi:hypothetical protein